MEVETYQRAWDAFLEAYQDLKTQRAELISLINRILENGEVDNETELNEILLELQLITGNDNG